MATGMMSLGHSVCGLAQARMLLKMADTADLRRVRGLIDLPDL